MRGEPWVELATGLDLAGWGKQEEIAYNQANRQRRKLEFFVQAFDFLAENQVRGDYYEYGCHRARTFRMALTEARRHNLDGMRFLAFDSFEGLPGPLSPHEVAAWKRGALATSEEDFKELIAAHGIYTDRCETFKGFYGESLTADLAGRLLDSGSRVALATVDCDLYESAVPVLRFLEPLLQEGAVVYVDDMFAGYRGSPLAGVSLAFREHRDRSRFRYAEHMSVGWWGKSFIVYEERR